MVHRLRRGLQDRFDDREGKKRIQKWRTIRGSKKQAQKKLTEILRDLDKGEYVERSNQTLGEWLTSWLEKAVKPSRRASTYRRYRDIIENNIPATLKAKPVQEVSALDLEQFYAEQRTAGYAASTVAGYHTLLHGALKAAASPRVSLVQRNVASLVEGKPKIDRNPRKYRQLLGRGRGATVSRSGDCGRSTAGGVYALALDCGGRKNELAALQWRDLDLERARQHPEAADQRRNRAGLRSYQERHAENR